MTLGGFHISYLVLGIRTISIYPRSYANIRCMMKIDIKETPFFINIYLSFTLFSAYDHTVLKHKYTHSHRWWSLLHTRPFRSDIIGIMDNAPAQLKETISSRQAMDSNWLAWPGCGSSFTLAIANREFNHINECAVCVCDASILPTYTMLFRPGTRQRQQTCLEVDQRWEINHRCVIRMAFQ